MAEPSASAPLLPAAAAGISAEPENGGPTDDPTSSAADPSTTNGRQPGKLKYVEGLALVLGLQIGSGIFSTPSVVARLVPTPLIAVLLWLFAGFLVWTGATSFIELGTAVPRNGGMQEYLHACYGDVPAFLFSSFWVVIVKPCALALISTIFSEYLHRAVQGGHQQSFNWTVKGVALLAILLSAYISCRGTRSWAKTANILFAVKLIGLGSIAIGGLSALWIRRDNDGLVDGHRLTESHNLTGMPTEGEGLTFAKTSDALFAALFAYGGWESVREPRYSVECR